jgi:simple sugar transport system ATP-binding protein
MPQPLLEARGVHKRFGRVHALRGADFTVHPGEIVALVGDNGAGKSTLIKVLSGVHTPDGGELRFEGQPVAVPSAVAARRLGIETVYQDLSLAPDLDAPANLFLGREILRKGLLGRLGFLDRAAMRAQAAQAFATLGVTVRGELPVAGMSGGQRQGVAVSRAVAWASKIVILDEPTAALGAVQTRRVLDLVRRVRDAGIAVVLISHDLPHVLQIADRVEVLRLGRRVAVFTRGDATMPRLLGAITGAVTQETEEVTDRAGAAPEETDRLPEGSRTAPEEPAAGRGAPAAATGEREAASGEGRARA